MSASSSTVSNSTPSPHRIVIVMSSAGRFLECTDCNLGFAFPAGAHFDTIANQFEGLPCRLPTSPPRLATPWVGSRRPLLFS